VPEQPIKDKTAIAGVGWTEFSRNSGVSTLTLATEASLKAIDDAGLKPSDIDGVVTWYHAHPDTPSAQELASAMELDCRYELFANEGGHWMPAAVMTGAAAVYAGMCNNLLMYVARNGYSEGRARRAGRVLAAEGADQFRFPFGMQQAATIFALPVTAHMARYGTTTLDFAHLAVTQRKHASLNTKALMRQPMTIEDHQTSRWISYPYRLLDCCQQNDGAVAIVITSAERAQDLRHRPVYIMAGYGGDLEAPTAGIWETNGVNVAPLIYEGAGITARDVSLAELYDPFTGMCLLHIEDFGLVAKGEAGRWVAEGRSGLDGEVPVNTHGGLLSEGHFTGLNHVVEAVQQLRPEGVTDDLCQGTHTYDRSVCRQVRDPEIALLCGESGGSGMLLRRG
jgi:acetyl-CoA acetyltransferase